MYKVCKECGKQFDLSVKKCPECGRKLKKQFTEEKLEEIQKQNDDFTTINTFMLVALKTPGIFFISRARKLGLVFFSTSSSS